MTAADDERSQHNDLRATGATWLAVRGDEPLKIKQRCGHQTFGTAELYIREAEAVRDGFGAVFPPLPAALLAAPESSGESSGRGPLASNQLRGQDLNLRPSGYEPDELPGCSTARVSGNRTDAVSQVTCSPSDAGPLKKARIISHHDAPALPLAIGPLHERS